MNRDIKSLSGTELNALINAGWDGKNPLPLLTDEELSQLFNDQQRALDKMMGIDNPSQITPNQTGS